MAMASAADTALPPRDDLREFLRERYGGLGLRSAFEALDTHGVGQVTSDGFVKGLQRLGFQGDAAAVFHGLDKAQTGLVDSRAFVEGIGGLEDEEIDTTMRTMSSCRSLDSESLSSTRKGGTGSAWTSARIPRLGSDSQLARPPRHRKLSRGAQGLAQQPAPGAQQDDRAPRPASLPAPAASAAAARDAEARCEELMARLARVEEQLQVAQTTERGVAEQLDSLRQQIVEESAQRQVDSTSLRADLEIAKSDAQQAGSELAELRADVMEKLDLDASRPDSVVEGSASSALAAKLEELSMQVNTRLDRLETNGIDLAATQAVPVPQPSNHSDDEVRKLKNFTQDVKTQMDAVSNQLATLQYSLENGELHDALRRSEELVQRQMEDLRGEVEAMREQAGHQDLGVSPAQMEGYVRTKLDALRDELAVSLEEERARGFAQAEDVDEGIAARAVAEAQAEARTIVRCEIEKLRATSGSEMAAAQEPRQGLADGRASDEQVKRFMVSLQQMGQELEILAANEAGTRRDLTLLQKEVDGLPPKFRSLMSPDLTDLRNRLSKLEHERQYNARTERSGCSSSNGGPADDSLRNLVEDRLATFDIGLARVSNDLREQAGAIEDLKGKQSELNTDLQGKLRRLIAKVNSKCEEGFALATVSDLGQTFEDISISTPKMAGTPTMAGFAAKDAPRLLGSHPPSHSSPKLPLQAVSRSQSCGTLWQQPADAPELPDTQTTLQALREENLRLREANLEIREQAIQTGGKPAAAEDVGAVASSAQVCPMTVVAPAVVQTLPPTAPVQRVGMRRLSAYEAPRSPVMRMASQGARSPTTTHRGISQVVREVSAPMKGQVISKTVHGAATPQPATVVRR